ncbi:hypothetical protein ACFQES_43660 [Nonomuraea salmonea]|uniref:hypothetical protein n=1 Tax=Nonomuraea salmonea TaxID=46181 RepID=UPI003614904F
MAGPARAALAARQRSSSPPISSSGCSQDRRQAVTNARTNSQRGSRSVCRSTCEVVLFGSASTRAPSAAATCPPSARSRLSDGSPAHCLSRTSAATNSAASPACAGSGGRGRSSLTALPS